MANLVSGLLIAEIGGLICEFEGEFTVQPNNREREPKISHSGKVGYKSTPIAPRVTGTMQVYGAQTAAWYAGLVNAEVTVKTDGRTYKLTGATSVGTYEHALIEGTVPVDIFAQTCDEITD